GLKKARFSNIAPWRPTLAWAKEERPVLAGGRFCGSGTADGTGKLAGAVAAGFASFVPTLMAGRGRGSGTFSAAAAPVSADSAQAAVNVKQIPTRPRLVAFIQPHCPRNRRSRLKPRGPQTFSLTRPISLTNNSQNLDYWTLSGERGKKWARCKLSCLFMRLFTCRAFTGAPDPILMGACRPPSGEIV